MKSLLAHCGKLAALALTLATLGGAHAQESAWRPFVSVTPVYQGTADLEGGGDYSAWSALLRAGVSGSFGNGNRAALTLNYDYTDYSFSNPLAFAGAAPWGVVQRFGVAVPLSFGIDPAWSVGFAPSVDWFRENGADTGEAFTWGGILSATRRFEGGNRIGFGIGAYDRIEDSSLFPVLLVDWRINDRWRLTNPLTAGPTGPAGLELDYRLDDSWNFGLGAAWRSTRFRLSESGAVPNGIGEERGVPVFLRATHAFDGRTSLNLYAGIVTGGQLRLEDATGGDLVEDDFDPAPLFGATFNARF